MKSTSYPGPEMPENIAAFWPETIEDAKGDGFDGGDTTCAQRAQSSFGWMKNFHKWTWFLITVRDCHVFYQYCFMVTCGERVV